MFYLNYMGLVQVQYIALRVVLPVEFHIRLVGFLDSRMRSADCPDKEQCVEHSLTCIHSTAEEVERAAGDKYFGIRSPAVDSSLAECTAAGVEALEVALRVAESHMVSMWLSA